MLTVGELVSDCGLALAAGEGEAGRSVRCIHVAEQEDPSPWLSQDEVVLTTGHELGTAAKLERFVAFLADSSAAGLGFGTGSEHSSLPRPVVDAASRRGLPLFEIPPGMPFVAITGRAAKQLTNDEGPPPRQSVRVQDRLERLLSEGSGLDEILATTAAAIAGAAILYDVDGREVANHPAGCGLDAEASAALGVEIARRANSRGSGTFSPEGSSSSLALPVPGERGGGPAAWLAVVTDRPRLGKTGYLYAHHAAMVLGVELMSSGGLSKADHRGADNGRSRE